MVVVLISYGLLYVLEMMRKLVDSVRKPVVQENVPLLLQKKDCEVA